jgi:hypothetical protein
LGDDIGAGAAWSGGAAVAMDLTGAPPAFAVLTEAVGWMLRLSGMTGHALTVHTPFWRWGTIPHGAAGKVNAG